MTTKRFAVAPPCRGAAAPPAADVTARRTLFDTPLLRALATPVEPWP